MMNRRIDRKSGFTLVELLLTMALLALLMMLVLPNFMQARKRSAYSVCGENLKSIAVSLQVYANDHFQTYPSALSALAPNYLESVPTCPSWSVGDTYSPSYERSDAPATFTVLCKGFSHIDVTRLGPDHPIFTLERGLLP